MRSLLLALALVVVPTLARAQTVAITSRQDTSLGGTGGAKLSAVACNAAAGSRWTGWISVGNQRNVVLDVDFVDADASAASLDYRCQTSRASNTANGAGRDLPVILSTAAGVSTIAQSTISWKSTAGAAPGTSSYTTVVSNIPAPFLNCLFTCGAGGAAADNITVFARGVNP